MIFAQIGKIYLFHKWSILSFFLNKKFHFHRIFNLKSSIFQLKRRSKISKRKVELMRNRIRFFASPICPKKRLRKCFDTSLIRKLLNFSLAFYIEFLDALAWRTFDLFLDEVTLLLWSLRVKPKQLPQRKLWITSRLHRTRRCKWNMQLNKYCIF